MSSYPQIAIHITVVALVLALTSCDFLSADGNSPYVEPEFSVTNDVTNRLTLYDDTGSSESKAKPSRGIESELSVAATVRPPVVNTEATRASHLDYDGEYIHVGYKTYGEKYGGGVDIFSADGDLEVSNRSFQGNDFDVQEVVYDNGENAIYIAGAVKGKITGDFKAQLLKLDGESAEVMESISTEGNLVKSIDRTDNYIYAVSDQNHMYRFAKDLDAWELLPESASENVNNYRSIWTGIPNEIFTLDQLGTVRRVNHNYNGFRITQNLIGNNGQSEDPRFQEGTIARLSSFTHTNGRNYVLAALNEFGFTVLDTEGAVKWNSKMDSESIEVQNRHYTSVTTFEPSGPSGKNNTYVYAGGSDETGNYIDIFEVPNGFNGRGLTLVNSHNLDEFSEINSSGQVNHIVATQSRLYVAKGSDGLVIFDLE
ncbi:hypothetical protein LQ318_01035 [Aliifodinibius salicampi]|uniref:Beta-propeller repeat-containing protein n=1 Tax=Fodinibius salicampi TaxID=1920655 RepID=A0ABT3PUG9_9BACT|nr:hypothetical protein [Fodinibius salicampi]MCW9711473.1 hypothetical protein [Fodinibius salicampi]